ncbi:hypothetical protein RRG08_008439 [Elysia crispata]|uniref:Uncharacterized protein n=1 Tax=Elysia crispata TaxID=231223 RepID=A0AAE1AZA6_9GAST|nr:hypothetical protein RRG08_008439 [Elysia crispata]
MIRSQKEPNVFGKYLSALREGTYFYKLPSRSSEAVRLVSYRVLLTSASRPRLDATCCRTAKTSATRKIATWTTNIPGLYASGRWPPRGWFNDEQVDCSDGSDERTVNVEPCVVYL